MINTKKHTALSLIQMSNYVRPNVVESKSNDWVLNGKNNSFYQYIIDRYNGSPTNSAVINSYIDRVYGEGLKLKRGSVEDFIKFKIMLSSQDVYRVVTDYVLFGEASMQIIKANGKNDLPKVYHLPKQDTAPQKADEDNNINGYYFSLDWTKVNQNPPEYLPLLGTEDRETECYVIRPYRAGRKYFSDPDYISGLQYSLMEEEISNYYISHIQNGLSFGYIINIPDGNNMTEEEKEDFEKKIKSKLIGSTNAGKFILSFNGIDAEITVTPLEISDAHSQWEYLTSESRQQILTSHRVVSPMLFGVKDSTGLGNNADELKQSNLLLYKDVIRPKQRYLIEAFEDIAYYYGLNIELEFEMLGADIVEEVKEVENIEMSKKKSKLDEFISLGRDSLDGYYMEESFIIHDNDDELLQFADVKTGTARPTAKGDGDNEDVLIRYRYTGNPNPEREFCKEMMKQNKIYRKEDILAMSTQAVNPGFGMNGTDTYSIWDYKGGGLLSDNFPGGTCKHKWQMEIYVKNGVKIDPRSPLAKTITRRRALKSGYDVPTDKGTPFVTPHSIR